MVFCAKQTVTCGSMQNIHQQLVLCAISSANLPLHIPTVILVRQEVGAALMTIPSLPNSWIWV
jgi:hypothetical protein